jgi:hypothetical protein
MAALLPPETTGAEDVVVTGDVGGETRGDETGGAVTGVVVVVGTGTDVVDVVVVEVGTDVALSCR